MDEAARLEERSGGGGETETDMDILRNGGIRGSAFYLPCNWLSNYLVSAWSYRRGLNRQGSIRSYTYSMNLQFSIMTLIHKTAAVKILLVLKAINLSGG